MTGPRAAAASGPGGVASPGLGRRAEHLARLRAAELDVLVVGGGITGAGIALDAAARGLRVGLVDKGDFAGGTSSRSTKLVHGGLRYLAQLQFAVTHESLAERDLLQNLAPGLVEWLPFVLPMYDSPLEYGKVAIGLWLYDALAARRAPSLHRPLGRKELLALAPGLAPEGLLGGFVYSDCRTDDVRLTLEVLRTAVGRGATVANHAEVVGFVKEPSPGGAPQVRGAEVVDRRTGEELTVRARQTIVAGGVWLDRILRLDHPAAPRRVRPAKGVHLVVQRERLGFDAALFLPTRTDGRLVFVIPWQGATLIGTTDTEYAGPLEAPLATSGDVAYLLESVNRAFPGAKLAPTDVVSLQAGLRPLVSAGDGQTTRLSRADRVFETPSGLIAIAGGKLTTYRRMAERVVDLAASRLAAAGSGIAAPVCPTDRIPLGGFAPGPAPALPADLQPDVAEHLRATYGANAADIAALASGSPELRERIVPGLPSVLAEVVYAARCELAETIADALARRTHVVQLDPEQGQAAAARVGRAMGAELGWSEERLAAEVARFAEDVRQFSARDLPDAD